MISGVLLIIDKAIGLLKAREVRRETLFKEVIEPMFLDTEKIMNNYNKIFHRLLQAIETGNEKKIRAAALAFIEDRMEMKAARDKLFRFADAALGLPRNASEDMRQNAFSEPPREIDQFREFMISAIQVAFNQQQQRQSWSSGSAEVLRRYLTDPSGSKLNAESLAKNVRHAHEDSQRAWVGTCALYAHLKLSYSLGIEGVVKTRRSTAKRPPSY